MNKKRESNPLVRLKKDIFKTYQLYIMFLLPLLFILIFKYQPMYGTLMAFKDFDATKGIMGSNWVGLKYFTKFFTFPRSGQIVGNTVVLALYSLIFGFPIPILLALSLNNVRALKYKSLVQTITYAPHFISVVVIVGMVMQFLHPRSGVINLMLQQFGVPAISYLSEPKYFRGIYILSGIWQNAGWGSIIYLGALSAVSVELYEAAKIDGASTFQKTLYIDIPSIAPIVITMLILSVGGIMNIGFEKVFLLQSQLNLSTSEVISTFVYKQGIKAEMPNYSYAAAIGLFNSVVSLILLTVVNYTAKRLTETSLW